MEILNYRDTIYWMEKGIKESLMKIFSHPENLVVSTIVYDIDGYDPSEEELENLKVPSTESSNWNLRI
jgi:hypothetical protein